MNGFLVPKQMLTVHILFSAKVTRKLDFPMDFVAMLRHLILPQEHIVALSALNCGNSHMRR